MKLTNITQDVSALQKTRRPQEIQKVQMDTAEKKQTTQQETFLKDADKKKESVKLTVEKLNEFNDPTYTNLEFIFHEDLEKYYVTVVDPNTDEVIREIPPEKMLDMYAQMADYMGLLVDERI